MNDNNTQEFLNSLTEEQRAALTACRTEEELEQVIDDYDIEIPDEMLVGVAGGKGIMPLLMAGIIAFSGAAMTAAPITAGAEYVSERITPAQVEINRSKILAEAESELQDCISIFEGQMQYVYCKQEVNLQLINTLKVEHRGKLYDLSSVATIEFDDDDPSLEIYCDDSSLLDSIESAIKKAYPKCVKIDRDDRSIEMEFPYRYSCEDAILSRYLQTKLSIDKVGVIAREKLLQLYDDYLYNNVDYMEDEKELQKHIDNYLDIAKKTASKRAEELGGDKYYFYYFDK